MWVIGRYVLPRSTSAAVAAAIAAGDLTPRLWQAAVWNVKEACKRLGGARYLWVRERILRRYVAVLTFVGDSPPPYTTSGE